MSSTNKTNYSYTKKEIDSMGGGSSLSDTISQKADKSDLSNYLPLNGGQMSGVITSASDRMLVLSGGENSEKGPNLQLYGDNWQSDSKGTFVLLARNSEGTYSYLRGFPTGELDWRGKPIDVIDSQGDGYIRYSNGIQICWCEIVLNNYLNTNAPNYWSLPLSFRDRMYSVSVATRDGSADKIFGVGATSSSTTVTLVCRDLSGSTSAFTVLVNAIAIGRWK